MVVPAAVLTACVGKVSPDARYGRCFGVWPDGAMQQVYVYVAHVDAVSGGGNV